MATPGGHLAPVKRLKPLRVLLAGRDRRYIRVTSFLLEGRGYVVRSSTIEAAAEAARRHRSDVVLLEGDKLRSDTARNAAAIEALNPEARVVVVVDKHPTDWAGLATLAKWVELETVVDTLEDGSGPASQDEPDPAA
jgi:DNA-binding NtrC family response regulator